MRVAGQVDTGGHFAHARRTEDPKRDEVADAADKNDEWSHERVEVETRVEELRVDLDGLVSTR